MPLETNLSYELGSGSNCCGFGFLLCNETTFKSYVSDRVKKKFYDIKGTKELFDNFESIASTDFERKVLLSTFQNQRTADDGWMVGEALAECFLEDERGARFHYESSRDARNPRASLPGADLVGFTEIGIETVFLFGEVKTTSPSDATSPPSILYGRTGMIQQLEDLKSIPEKRAALVKWLGFKVDVTSNNVFLNDYKKALKMYLSSNRKKIKLVGVLVRDVAPQRTDLERRFGILGNNLSLEMKIELFGLYLPITIDKLVTLVGSAL